MARRSDRREPPQTHETENHEVRREATAYHVFKTFLYTRRRWYILGLNRAFDAVHRSRLFTIG
jgi:hypothetical protein